MIQYIYLKLSSNRGRANNFKLWHSRLRGKIAWRGKNPLSPLVPACCHGDSSTADTIYLGLMSNLNKKGDQRYVKNKPKFLCYEAFSKIEHKFLACSDHPLFYLMT